jgi:hypothetical protein
VRRPDIRSPNAANNATITQSVWMLPRSKPRFLAGQPGWDLPSAGVGVKRTKAFLLAFTAAWTPILITPGSRGELRRLSDGAMTILESVVVALLRSDVQRRLVGH